MFIIASEDDDEPIRIFERILETHHELSALADLIEGGATLAFAFQDNPEKPLRLRGNGALAYACMPAATISGLLKDFGCWLLEERLGYLPDFLIMIDRGPWLEATPLEREILVFHEVLHCGQAKDKWGCPRFNRETGRPVLGMVPHDVEEFTAVVGRYGAWREDLAEFLAAAAAHVPGVQIEQAPAAPALQHTPAIPVPPVTPRQRARALKPLPMEDESVKKGDFF